MRAGSVDRKERTCPGKFGKMSWNCPGNVLEFYFAESVRTLGDAIWGMVVPYGLPHSIRGGLVPNGEDLFHMGNGSAIWVA